jgi:hypothetical protein
MYEKYFKIIYYPQAKLAITMKMQPTRVQFFHYYKSSSTINIFIPNRAGTLIFAMQKEQSAESGAQTHTNVPSSRKALNI